jgi:transcriptional regulator with XRE-family HTH domain
MCSAPADDLYLILRHELKARHWTRRHFAQVLDTRESTVGRWLSTNPRTRKIPVPGTVLKIAAVLEFDPIELLQHAGHAPMAETQRSQHPHRIEIRARERRLRRILESVESSRFPEGLQWTDIVLDGLQAMAVRLEAIPINNPK